MKLKTQNINILHIMARLISEEKKNNTAKFPKRNILVVVIYGALNFYAQLIR